jgi:hypothetical protein
MCHMPMPEHTMSASHKLIGRVAVLGVLLLVVASCAAISQAHHGSSGGGG